MANDQDFWAAYKRPEWQRKRLEVMERAGFKCEGCGAEGATLNVHHGYYEKGKMPWEYPGRSLHCLCESCHSLAQEVLTSIKHDLGRLSPVAACMRAFGYISALAAEANGFRDVFTVDLFTREFARGVADYYRVDADGLFALAGPEGRLTLGEIRAFAASARGGD